MEAEMEVVCVDVEVIQSVKTSRMKLMMAPERSFCSTAAVGTLKIWIATLHHSVTSIRLHASLKTNVKHTML